jgi:hypothetical protein
MLLLQLQARGQQPSKELSLSLQVIAGSLVILAAIQVRLRQEVEQLFVFTVVIHLDTVSSIVTAQSEQVARRLPQLLEVMLRTAL